jgi:hypothetical protein
MCHKSLHRRQVPLRYFEERIALATMERLVNNPVMQSPEGAQLCNVICTCRSSAQLYNIICRCRWSAQKFELRSCADHVHKNSNGNNVLSKRTGFYFRRILTLLFDAIGPSETINFEKFLFRPSAQLCRWPAQARGTLHSCATQNSVQMICTWR